MKVIALFITVLLAFLSVQARSEVGETDVIDAIATKPGGARAVLVLNQARPWDEQSISLLQRKLAYYAGAVSSGALLKQNPDLHGRAFRIVVVYRESPTPEASEALRKAMADLQAQRISLKWGTQQQLIELAETP